MTSPTSNEPHSKRPRRMARVPMPQAASLPFGKQIASNGTAASSPQVPPDRRPTKTSLIHGLLTRPEGATLEQMVEATGWLAHTTRAALTGLKKKGHEVTSVKADGVRTYRAIDKRAGDPAAGATAGKPEG